MNATMDSLTHIRLGSMFWKKAYGLQPFLQRCIKVDWDSLDMCKGRQLWGKNHDWL